MHLISYVSTKGGCGKTTLSVHHAHWLLNRGYRVGFIDADHQALSSRWLHPLAGCLQLQQANSVERICVALRALNTKCDFVIADGAGGANEQNALLIRESSLCLIPMMVSPLDLFSTYADARRLIKGVSERFGVVPTTRSIINGLDKRARLSKEMLSTSARISPTPLNSTVRRLNDFVKAAGSNRPTSVFNLSSGLAKDDLTQLYSEIDQLLSKPRKIEGAKSAYGQ